MLLVVINKTNVCREQKRLKRKKVFKLAHTPYIYTLQQGKIFHHTLLAICVGSSNLQLVIFLSIALFANFLPLIAMVRWEIQELLLLLAQGLSVSTRYDTFLLKCLASLWQNFNMNG